MKKVVRCCDLCFKVEFSQREEFKQSQIEELERQLVSNEEEMEKERSQHSSVLKQLGEAQETISRMEGTNKSQGLESMRTLQAKLEKKKRKVDQMRDKIASNATEGKALEESLEAAQRMVARLQDQTADSLERERGELTTNVAMLTARLQARKEKKRVILPQIDEERRLKVELTEHVAALEGRIEELQKKLDSVAGEKGPLVEKVAGLQEQHRALKVELTEKKARKEKFDQLVATFEQMKVEINEKSQESDGLQGEIAQKKAESAENKAKIAEFTAKCADLQSQIEPLLKQISEIQHSRPQDSSVVLQLSDERETATQQLESIQTMLKSRSDEAESEKKREKAMQDASNALNSQITELQNSAKTSSELVITLKNENSAVKAQIEAWNSNASEVGKEITDAKADVEAKDKLISELEARLEELEKSTVPVSDKKCCAGGCQLF